MNDDNVLQLKAATPAYQEHVIAAIEEMLERAKAGQTMAIMAVEVNPGGEWSSILTGERDSLRYMGMLETLKMRIYNET